MSFRDNGVVILLGAGASKDANIPTSMDMIKDIEKWIFEGKEVDGTKWGEFKDLYCCIRSAIYYSDGIHGRFDSKVNYNIEKLVNTLKELEESESHAIYPFVGNWNIKLVEVAGAGFTNIKRFRDVIVAQLKAWVTIWDYGVADYYKNLFTFQDEYGFPLRVFTLNYDLCVDKHRNSAILERGFDEKRRWEWRRFEYNENVPVDIYLYKMHGAIDWVRDDDGNLTWSDEVAKIALPDLIFGTNYKLQYIDPYLFFAYEFRRYTLDSQLILTIGYGFGDEHINVIIGQALRNEPKRRLLCVLLADKNEENERKNQIKNALQMKNGHQIKIANATAKQFMLQDMTITKLNEAIPLEEGIPEFGQLHMD